MGKGVARWDPAHVTPKVKLCMHTMFYVCCSKGLSFQSTLWPDINTEMGVVIYMHLKHSPDYIDSKYVFMGLTP